MQITKVISLQNFVYFLKYHLANVLLLITLANLFDYREIATSKTKKQIQSA